MEYPIPTHLKGIFDINKERSDEHDLEGKIVCTCGCDRFKLFHNEEREYDCSRGYTEQDGLKVAAVCESCGARHLIFDEAKHGYNGFVCGDCLTAPDDSLEELYCTDCGPGFFSVRLAIEVEDKEQFIEECVSEYPDRFTPDDYVDSFDRITIYVRCPVCGEETEWISMELS